METPTNVVRQEAAGDKHILSLETGEASSKRMLIGSPATARAGRGAERKWSIYGTYFHGVIVVNSWNTIDIHTD